jgi:hypothetical protein
MTARLQPLQRARFLWAKNSRGSDWILLRIARLEGLVFLFEAGRKHAYSISLRFHALFCLKAFCLDLKLFRTSIFSVSLSGIDSRVKVKNIVPVSSQIMTACKRGDTSTVWSLFQAAKASVNDITPENCSPLRAITKQPFYMLNGESRERSCKLNIVANHEGNKLNPQLSVGWQPYSGNSIQLALKNIGHK